MEGRCGGGIAFQDSFKHIHVSLDTRLPRQLLLRCSTSCIPAVVSRTVLTGNPPTTPSTSRWFTYQKPLAYAFAHSRGGAVPYFRTLSDRDVAPAYMDVFTACSEERYCMASDTLTKHQ